MTRDSLLTIARDMGIKTEERKISYKELEEAFNSGKKVEAFGVGTAAVLSTIEVIDIKGKKYFPDVSETAIQFRLKEELQAVRSGVKKDKFGWNLILNS